IPDSRVANLGIVAATVRDSPAPQAMVRLRNDSDVSSARLEVTTAGRATATQIPLPPAGAAAGDVFIDLPEAGDVIKFRLVAEDAMEADNVAWLVRAGGWPRLEPRVALSPVWSRRGAS